MSNDLISRQALIEKIDQDISMFEKAGHCKSADILKHVKRIVKDDLPSAQPERKWIPCSERLPEIDMSYSHGDMYLVQYESGDMDVAQWSNANLFWALHVTEPYWICAPYTKVIAWMPLPEPYQEGDDNEQS